MKVNKVFCEISKELDCGKIPVDFVYNRFDLQKHNEVYIIKVTVGTYKEFNIQVLIRENIAELGIQLSPLSKRIVKLIIRFVFKKFSYVDTVSFKNSYINLGLYSKHNYFVLNLPEEFEKLQSRLSTEGRKKIRKRTNLVQRELGNIKFISYTNENVPINVIESYFEFKSKTHNKNYKLSPKEYLEKYFVTNIYVMYIENIIVAIRLTCEQGCCVYAENHSYDNKYERYRLGQLLYHYVLGELVTKGKQSIFLGGGDYDYKRHYGSEEKIVYDCRIRRGIINKIYDRLVMIYRKIRKVV